MMRPTIGRGALAALICFLWAGETRADFAYSYVFDQTSFIVSPGGEAIVRVSLQEIVSGGDVSRLATDGLIGAAARLRFDVAPVPSDAARVASYADVLPNTAEFDDSLFAFTDLVAGSYAEFVVAVDIASPAVPAADVGPGVYQIFLGSFRVTAGLIPGQVTILQLEDVPGTSDTVTGSGFVLDPFIRPARATIQVAVAIPEPSSLALGGIASLACLGTGLRRPRPGRKGPGSQGRSKA